MPFDSDDMMKILRFGMKLKDRMVREKLTAAKHKCKFCMTEDSTKTHYIHARLYPNRRFNHGLAIHMACDNPECNIRMME